MIPQHIEQRIKDAAKIYDVVSQFVTLKRSGTGYVALCPFHSERTPSFHVTPAKGIYKCFGCGEGGNSISFLMEYKRLDYPDALRYLAAMYHIDTEETTGHRPDRQAAPKPKPAPRTPPPPPPPPSYIPEATFRKTLKAYETNNFAAFLARRFGAQTATDLIWRYFTGTEEDGKVVFWYIDSRGNVRSGKVMQYDPATGKRDRNTNPAWEHTQFKNGFNYVACWYGEHLLPKRPGAPVGIAESEKTAIVASLYLPDYVWLACGGNGGLPSNPERWEALRGRRIVLFPDCDPIDNNGMTPFKRWSEIADTMRKMGYNIAVSDLLERTATDAIRANKYDLADYLLKFDPIDFHSAQDAHTPAPQPAQGTTEPDAALPHTQADEANQMHNSPPQEAPQTDAVLLTPEGYAAAWDDPMPDTVLSALEAVELMKRYGWQPEGTWQPFGNQADGGAY